MSLTQILSGRSPGVLIIISTILVALIGAMDYFTGAEISFSIFYLIPVSILSWYLNSLAGLLGSIVCAAVWIFVDIHSGRTYSHPAIPYWNGLVRFGFFVTVSYVLTKRKKADAKAALFVRELESNNRRITVLSETGDLLQACTMEAEAHIILNSSIPRIFPQSSGVLYSINSSRDTMESVVLWGEYRGKSVASPQECWSLRTGKSYFVQDPQLEVTCGHLHDTALPYLCIPMIANGETFGVMNLQAHRLDEPDLRVCASIADQAALALSNLRLRESLRNQAIRDALTGLFNRRYTEETLQREIRRSIRTDSQIGIILMDIDHFKKFNDTFGHAAGDILLREFGILLRAQIRGGDVASRYGGEEFILILPETSLKETVERALNLQETVKRLNVEYRGQVLAGITVSMGIASFPVHGASIEGLLQAADAALYQAKNEGRDRVVVTAH